MANIFQKIQLRAPKSNQFDLSHDYKTTFKMGQLIPMHVQEVIPGDKFRINSKNMIRLAPMVAPAMHRVKVYTSYFFVPNRIIWPNWEKFITGGESGMDNPAPPIFPEGHKFMKNSLGDYMGIPISDPSAGVDIKFGPLKGAPVSLLPFAAYALIWYEYYRDQNLQDTIPRPELTDGENALASWMQVPQRRAWRHDYLTSALPFAQKGDAVSIPVAGQITGTGEVYTNNDDILPMQALNAITGTPISSTNLETSPGGYITNPGADPIVIDPQGRLSVDGEDYELGEIATTINDLRTAYSLQKWLEKNARAGSRYIESLRAHFFTSPTDARLQRPEMIGSNVQNVIISEVLQTSSSDDTSPQGNMAGHGISASKDGHFKYTAQEHGFIIGIVSVMPDTAYCDGLPRHFSRMNRLDYYWPDFANLGEQAIYGREVCASAGDETTSFAQNTSTFGYIPRYAEYRFQNSLATGGMRPGLEYGHWTLTRKFNPGLPPPLNEDFIVCSPSKRIFAVEDEQDNEIIAHIFNDVKAIRTMPKYANPGW